MGLLEGIGTPRDVKSLAGDDIKTLCAEIREFLIKSVSETGGHLASNLGVVELTVALHRVFDTMSDRLVFDVGHQSYVHMLLTGRKEAFGTLRQYGGLPGFPRPSASGHDAFIAGHASTSVSAALGIARARTLSGAEFSVIAVIGDGALTGGLSYEGLSDAGESGEPLIVVLNDNGMSISNNVGGMARYLSRSRMKPSYQKFKKRYRRLMEVLPGGRAIYRFTHRIKTVIKEAILNCSIFEDMGFQYSGPVDGHDVQRIIEALQWAKRQNAPVLVHVITKKGKGYPPAERSPEDYHSVGPSCLPAAFPGAGSPTFSSVFGEELIKLAEKDGRICAITASMATGTGLSGFAARFPERFFDVGIAEGHAAVMAAGMASGGAVPVFAVYSTFLQRSYDMLVHDVAIGGLHVVLAVDRAGIVPGDGETHQGLFDVAYLRSIPGMAVYSPSNHSELRDMLSVAVYETEGPVAVRYPKGSEGEYRDGGAESAKTIRSGNDLSIVTYGEIVNEALRAAQTLESEGISVEIVKLGRIYPPNLEAVEATAKKTGRLLIVEECAGSGSVGEHIAAMLHTEHHKTEDTQTGANVNISNTARPVVALMDTGNGWLPCGESHELRKNCGIDAAAICETAGRLISVSKEITENKENKENAEKEKGIKDNG